VELMYRNDLIGTYSSNSISIKNQTQESIKYFGSNVLIEGALLENFIRDRIISPSRLDIHKILTLVKMHTYNIYEISLITRLINPMDGFWLRANSEESYESFVIPRLMEMFNETKLQHLNTMSSGGQNIKYYTKYKDKFGVKKRRLAGLTYDSESELAVYNLANRIRVSVCPTYKVDEDNTFSEFQFNFLNEEIVHMRHLLPDYNEGESTYEQVVRAFPSIKIDIVKMLILDYITAQDDRHLSNYAMKGDSLYPLYDNGRSLFWDCREQTIIESLTDVKLYSTSFGTVGTYYEILSDISKEGIKFSELVDLDLTKQDIEKCYEEEYMDYRCKLLVEWTYLTIQELKKLDAENSKSNLTNKSNIFKTN